MKRRIQNLSLMNIANQKRQVARQRVMYRPHNRVALVVGAVQIAQQSTHIEGRTRSRRVLW